MLNRNTPPEAIDLISSLLEYDPTKRPPARECLKHPFFDTIKVDDEYEKAANLMLGKRKHRSDTSLSELAKAEKPKRRKSISQKDSAKSRSKSKKKTDQ